MDFCFAFIGRLILIGYCFTVVFSIPVKQINRGLNEKKRET